MADDKTTESKDDKRPPLQAVAPDNKTPQFDQSLILKRMIDPVSGFYCLACTPDNGVTWLPQFTTMGKVYRKEDAKNFVPLLQEWPIEKLKFKSPDGTAFYLSVSNDGQPVFTKVGDSQ